MLLAALRRVLDTEGALTVAVSGGVDSLTLAAAAAALRPAGATTLCHAQSPAVPSDALGRVQAMAARTGLALRIVDAGEFGDARYRANPVNRCYFCKSNLYATLAAMGGCVASGTNLDDLGDYRPGLEAAREHGVRHPFVEAGLRKADVRALARELGLGALAELPASPCLSSRVRTGLRIEPDALRRIDRIEAALRDEFGAVPLRCRQEPAGLAIELDAGVLDGLGAAGRARVQALVAGQLARDGLAQATVPLRPYRMGSAFVHG
ncbi:adenine nucleotide alpha hydrolase [Pararhodobacter sp. SW119]|uniref:adenine nucleotide alpha hydrolase n=1 Tax=Pararhodobacter sp. SW119 TaxID=2780075 RepID=UPI001AE064F8|nr:adenine nucleotide alpha hydrolase [Pararhodobacter sp. SW119]